ncbi:kinesin-like protein KIF26A [Oryzias melastigma]|uniref:kinesin-like protein KIF26A n=1 Tax=Oryzias melastigma TaxID=30732 RepID=UPI00168D4D61|nr:kinesin-like protein KIF26A [Oryzias melastigma]
MTPRPATPNMATSVRPPPAMATAYEGDEHAAKQQGWTQDGQQLPSGALLGWGGVQSTYLGGGGAKGLATVTPINAHNYLEGVWRVTCCKHEQTTGSSSAACHMISKTTIPVKPEAHSIATQTSQPLSGAAAFFIRAAQKFSLPRRRKSQLEPSSQSAKGPSPPLLYTGGFSGALQLSPPAVPPCLLRAGSKVKDTPAMGKVRVAVRICSVPSPGSPESMSFLKVDSRKKQLTLYETAGDGPSSSTQRRSSAPAPKTFNFDAVFSQDASQAEVCSATVAEVIQSVVNGADGCIFGYGHADLGKTYTMIGRDCSTQSLGVAPTAISWLFKVIEERKEKSGTRFSVKVSAVEISGREETLTDLLAELATSAGGQREARGPTVVLREDPVCGSQLLNQTELWVTNAERAAFFLDAALAERRNNRVPSDEEARRNSHFLFTLHLCQEKLDKSLKAAVSGRSRLHLLDLGSCETDISRTREGGGGQCLSLSALGNVVLALANGAKHVPYRDSKLTMLLSESLGNINCQTTMIAHVSDSPTNYMETLTTVQLASRIYRTRKKKTKYASSSSGGESSCEEGSSRRPPHLRPFQTRGVTLNSGKPPLFSSEPDYTSSSEQSCDTVIYVGPEGTPLSDRELSDNEGPPSFVPIIPSLNKKRVKDPPKSDGDHLKCNTFAELQERLDCIDGSEGPATVSTETRAAQAEKTEATNSTVETSKLNRTPSQSYLEIKLIASDPAQRESKLPLAGCLVDSSKRTSADGEKISPIFAQTCLTGPIEASSYDPEPVVRQKVFSSPGLPKPSNSTSPPRTNKAAVEFQEGLHRTPPVGMSFQASWQGHSLGPSDADRVHQTTRYPLEVSNIRAALLGRCLDMDLMKTTVTLQQPVELNGEDELVFTIIEELPHSLVPDNGRPSNLHTFSADCSLQALAPAFSPVSIITSINDEYDAYMTQHREKEADLQSSSGSCPTETADNFSTNRNQGIAASNMFSGLQPHGLKSSFNDSGICFSELDSYPTTPSKPPSTKGPPSPGSSFTKISPKLRAHTLNVAEITQTSHHTARSSLPRKTKSTSSSTVGCSRQDDKQDEFLFQETGYIDHGEMEFFSATKLSRNGTTLASSKKTVGKFNSTPRSPKAQIPSSAQRVVDGCERFSSRRGDTLIKVPQLTRGATTLGTVSIPQTADSRWVNEAASAIKTVKFSSLGKKPNGQRSSAMSRSGSENICPASPVRQSAQDQKTRSPSALKTSIESGRFAFPKTSEEELTVRFRSDSFNHRTSGSKTDHGSPKKLLSVKTRENKSDSARSYQSQGSLEKGESLAFAGSKPEVLRESSNVGVSSRLRSVPKLGLPGSTLTSSSQVSFAVSEVTSKLGQVRGSSRAAVSGGSKTQTLCTSSSKSLSTPQKLPETFAERSANLPPTGKSTICSGTGTRTGRGTVMGMKQAISRAANSRVSELVVGSPRKQLSKKPEVTGSDSTGTATSSIIKLPQTTMLPSPYSKLTSPRRPQRYSSGHGSDNSSILSGELPPAMGRTALFYHSGGSSGYESMIRDSETTGSTSSAHDSMSESGTSNRGRVSKSPKKRGNGGFQRRRLIPAPLPDASSLGRKMGGKWVDLPSLGSALKTPFEIKVYEIDDMEQLQKRKEDTAGSEPLYDVEKGLLYFNAQLRMLERRQQQIRELKSKHEQLKVELVEAKRRLMLHPSRWSGEFDVDQDLDQESQEYLEALAQVTAELEYCVNLCKSRVMMETCFDVAASTTSAAAPAGQKRMEV